MEKLMCELSLIPNQLNEIMNLLSCFEDFVQEEGEDRNFKNFEEKSIAAICFFERVTRYNALITTASELIMRRKEDIEKIVDEYYATERGVA